MSTFRKNQARLKEFSTLGYYEQLRKHKIKQTFENSAQNYMCESFAFDFQVLPLNELRLWILDFPREYFAKETHLKKNILFFKKQRNIVIHFTTLII